MIKSKIYLIEWADSCLVEHGWERIEDMENMQLMKCHSIGYILKETKDIIVIAAHISDVSNKDSLGEYEGALIIPKLAIIKREELTTQN